MQGWIADILPRQTTWHSLCRLDISSSAINSSTALLPYLVTYRMISSGKLSPRASGPAIAALACNQVLLHPGVFCRVFRAANQSLNKNPNILLYGFWGLSYLLRQ